MLCSICHQGETAPGTVTVALHRGEASVIIKGVPAEVCSNCGEYYLSEKVSEQVMKLAETAIADHAEVGVLRYAA